MLRRGQTLRLCPNVRARYLRYTSLRTRNYLPEIINKYANARPVVAWRTEYEMNPESVVLTEELNSLEVLFNTFAFVSRTI